MSQREACDAHLHVFDAGAPSRLPAPSNAGADDYRRIRSRLGLRRAVVVQPRHYGTDNSVLLAAIAALDRRNTRGIAVVRPDVADDELQRLHDGGVRGIRFSLALLPEASYVPRGAVVTVDMLAPLARRIADLGWHVQVHLTADQIVAHEAALRSLRVPVVFDHMARLPAVDPTKHPAFDVVRDLAVNGEGWVKLSAPYLCSPKSSRESWPGASAIARAWVDCVPHRLVWGSDWPHVTEQAAPPDTAVLLRLLDAWTGSAGTKRLILEDNPARLYGFE